MNASRRILITLTLLVTLAAFAVPAFAQVDLTDLQSERSYKPMVAYAQSKLACLMFAFELQKQSDAAGFIRLYGLPMRVRAIKDQELAAANPSAQAQGAPEPSLVGA